MEDSDRNRTGRAVKLSVEIEAGPDTVWGMLEDPERFSVWMGGRVTFEPRVGSPFRAEFPSYQTVISGEVVAHDRKARHLALTWGPESGPQAAGFPAASSRVEFRVGAAGEGCRVDLHHTGFPSDTLAGEHDAGWRFHLSRMDLIANRTDLSAGLKKTLPAWFAAWNEPDDGTRLDALRACCLENLEFRDAWAVARGVERLNVHIANCHRFMPGWKIEETGDVRICRGEALVGWRSTGPGGPVQGLNHVRATPKGMLRRVTGFDAS